MSIRESRIPHPAGARVIISHKWIANIFGKTAAMLVGHLDYLDRARDGVDEPLASRAELLAALEGFAGRDAVDAGLKLLTEAGWVLLIECQQDGGSNLRKWHEYALNIAEIENYLQTRADARRPEIRTPDVRKSGLKSGLKPGLVLVRKPGLKPGARIQEEVDVEEELTTDQNPNLPRGGAGVLPLRGAFCLQRRKV